MRGPRRFSIGQSLKFVLHRRSTTLMDVWLEPAASRKATIPLEEDRKFLKTASDAGFLTFGQRGRRAASLSHGERGRGEGF